MDKATVNGRGRPRDPLLEERVHEAACRLYGRLGWAGMNIESVAREARVGKSSIYLRWPDTASLLLDALTAQIGIPLDTDTGSVRDDLEILARGILALLVGDMGETLVRLSSEARSVPELAPRWRAFVEAQVSAVRRIIERGIARGEVPADVPTALVLDALVGGVLIHYLTSPDLRALKTRRNAERYTAALVDLVLRAVAL
jgi:AcrR family transcriptional regulator